MLLGSAALSQMLYGLLQSPVLLPLSLCWIHLSGLMTCSMQDKGKLEAKIRREYPPLKSAQKLEWGFKIRFFTFGHTHSTMFACNIGLEALITCLTAFFVACYRDKTRPNSAFLAENMTLLPAEADIEPTLGERVAKWLRSFRK